MAAKLTKADKADISKNIHHAMCSYSLKRAKNNLASAVLEARGAELEDVASRLDFCLLAVERTILAMEKTDASKLVDSDSNSSDSIDTGVES